LGLNVGRPNYRITIAMRNIKNTEIPAKEGGGNEDSNWPGTSVPSIIFIGGIDLRIVWDHR